MFFCKIKSQHDNDSVAMEANAAPLLHALKASAAQTPLEPAKDIRKELAARGQRSDQHKSLQFHI